MLLDEKTIKRIIKKYKDVFDSLEYYDKTHKKLWGRGRIDITLHRRVIKKLKDLKQQTGKSVSRIIEEAIQQI